jgi:hypothetical protein
MAEPLIVSREEAAECVAAHGRWGSPDDTARLARSLVVAYECIEMLAKGYTPHIADRVWVLYGVRGYGSRATPKEPMSPEQAALMAENGTQNG